MSLTPGNLTKGLYLFLFTLSSTVSLFKPSPQSAIIAVLSLIGFIAFDVVCQLKRKELKDSPEILELKAENKKLADEIDYIGNQFNVIKDNISIGSVAAAFRRK